MRCAGRPLALSLCLVCLGTTVVRRLEGQAAPPAREGYVDAGGGVRLFYRTLGTGRDTIVVLHGGPGFSMAYLAPDLEPLAAHHVLLFYDQRGAGRSTLVNDSTALDAQRFAEDLEAVRRQFGLERLTLLGHSWGAAVVALYAARYPERIGRVLIVDGISPTRALQAQGFQRLDARRDSTTRRRMQELRAARVDNPGSAAACHAYYEVWFAPTFADSSAMRRSRGDFCAGTPEALTNKVRSVDRFTMASLGEWDWRPGLRKVTAPALVIHGTADFIPVESSRAWAASLPNGRLLLIERSGHFPYLDTPKQFFGAVEEFVAGRWPARATAGSGSRAHP